MEETQTKRSRGRPAGQTGHVWVTLETLSQYFRPEMPIPVTRSWLKNNGLVGDEMPKPLELSAPPKNDAAQIEVEEFSFED